MPNPGALKIIIADDHEFFRIGFKKIFCDHYAREIEFIADASNGIELMEQVKYYQPDIVITDIQMPVLDGIQACKLIKQQYPQLPILAFSMFNESSKIMGMLQAGANGYLVKTSSKEEIIEAIRTVSRSEFYYCSTVSEKMYGIARNSNQKKNVHKKLSFSIQEKKVMQLICNQLSTKEIAVNMKLATRTIDHYRENIL